MAADKKDFNDDDVAGLDEIDEDAIVRLRSKDGEVFDLPKKSAMMSKLIKTAVENDKSKETDIIDLVHLESDIVRKIIEYMNYHSKVPPRSIEKPLASPNLKDLVDEWDAKFADVDQDMMFRILLAANYMHIQPLLLLMCAKVASLIKGRTPEEIRKTFGIKDDATPEEEEEVRKQYKDLLE